MSILKHLCIAIMFALGACAPVLVNLPPPATEPAPINGEAIQNQLEAETEIRQLEMAAELNCQKTEREDQSSCGIWQRKAIDYYIQKRNDCTLAQGDNGQCKKHLAFLRCRIYQPHPDSCIIEKTAFEAAYPVRDEYRSSIREHAGTYVP